MYKMAELSNSRTLSLKLYPELVTHYLDILSDSKFSFFEDEYKLEKF